MPKISLIVASDKQDKLLVAANLASTSAAMNWEANLFFTFWGLLALKKGNQSQDISSEYSQYKKTLLEAIKSGSLPQWRELIKKFKEGGKVKIFACSTTLDIFGIPKADLEDFVDDIVGAATFLSKAKGSDITLFIS
jgi:peroxiredoxin family protein